MRPKEILFHKTLSTRLIAFGVSIWIISEIVEFFIQPLDPLNPKWVPWIINNIGDIGLLIAIMLLISSSIRSIRKFGLSVLRGLSLLIGVGVSLGFISLCLLGYGTFNQLDQLNDSDWKLISKLSDNANEKNISLYEKSKRSKLHAKYMFIIYGKKIDYIVTNGGTIPYAPTEEDRETRKKSLEGEKILRTGKAMMMRGIYSWGTVLLIGLGIGLIFPIKKSMVCT